MKPDEATLLKAVFQVELAGNRVGPQATVRDLIARLEIPANRARYLLEKWSDRNWYEYDVVLDLGWLTESGRQKARELLAPRKEG